MRYIKLFEAFSEEPKFFRFSHIDLLNGESEIEFTPKQRKMVGPDEFNDILLELGFPDKKKCIHFMDERAFDPSYSGLYGKNHYNISIDPESKIGWSFLFPVNDWYFKGLPFRNARHEDIKKLEETEFGDFDYLEATEDEAFNSTMRVLEIGFIGTGKLKDLMSSKYWGTEKVFVWTEDTVRITPYIKPPKGSKGYKKEVLLTPDQFKTLGMSGPDIAEFHKSDEGKQFRELEDRMSAVKLVISYLKRIGKFNR